MSKLTKKGRYFDYSLLLVILFLLAFGLIMIFSTSSYVALKTKNDSAYYLKQQLISTGLGIVAMAVTVFIPLKFFKKVSPWLYVISLICVILVLSPIGVELNGARRWLKIGFSFQPAELVKLSIILFLAYYIYYSGRNIRKLRNLVVFAAIAGIAALMIYVITDNLSSAVIIVGIAYIMLIVISRRSWMWALIGIAAIILGIIILNVVASNLDAASGFRFKRIIAWKNPEKYASNVGYQTLQALYAIGSGGFFGKGLGQSIQKNGFIPEAQNDMIFSVICEELGIFGGIAVIILFIILIWRLVIIASNTKDLFSSMIVSGVVAHISIQVVLNIAVVTNTIPNTGVTLPFISYGGTSVIFLLVEMGLCLNISRRIQLTVNDEGEVE